MSRYVPVEGFSGLVRDTESNAILNLNYEEIELARERKRLNATKKQQQVELKQKVQTLEDDVAYIKKSLDLILEKLNT